MFYKLRGTTSQDSVHRPQLLKRKDSRTNISRTNNFTKLTINEPQQKTKRKKQRNKEKTKQNKQTNKQNKNTVTRKQSKQTVVKNNNVR